MVNTTVVKCEEIILYIFTYIMYVTIAGKVNVISKSSFCKQETVLIDDAHLHVLHVIQILSTKAIYSISLYDCVAIASIINTDRWLLINHLVYWIVHTHVTRNGSFLRYSKPRHIGKGEQVIDLIVILMYDIFPTKIFF
jgi:hypothetical protein